MISLGIKQNTGRIATLKQNREQNKAIVGNLRAEFYLGLLLFFKDSVFNSSPKCDPDIIIIPRGWALSASKICEGEERWGGRGRRTAATQNGTTLVHASSTSRREYLGCFDVNGPQENDFED